MNVNKEIRSFKVLLENDKIHMKTFREVTKYTHKRNGYLKTLGKMIIIRI